MGFLIMTKIIETTNSSSWKTSVTTIHIINEEDTEDMKLRTAEFPDSTVLKTAYYSDKYNCIVIHFRTGSVWMYQDVSHDTFYQLVSAKSAGNYFNNHIRKYYSALLIMGADQAQQVLHG